MMLNNKNCINCGAPIDAETIKCPYCGTSYFDFTDIDVMSPVILRIKDKDRVVLLKAMCSSMSFTVEPEYITCDLGPMSRRILTNTHKTIELTFEGVN